VAGGQLRIEQMYAFVMLDPEDNTEGIPAFHGAGNMAMPMVGANMAMVESLRPLAKQLAEQSGVKITLCRFEVRTEVEVIEP
jgi:predicted peroxiredoxin